MRKLKIIEVKSEIGAGTRGASLGSDAIKIAAMDSGSRFFKKYKSVEVPNENYLLLEPAGDPTAKRIAGVLTMAERVAEKVEEIVKNGEFPIILAGDHSISAGTISGIKTAYPQSSIGLVWIDAHADIHSPYTTPSGNVHGMAVAALLDEDNLDFKINFPHKETIEIWEKLKNIGNIEPKINYKNLVYISVRDTEAPEDHLIKKHKVKKFTTQQIRDRGVVQIAADTLDALKHCDLICVSFDVDSMDSAISMGTGTPVTEGLTVLEAGNLITALMQSSKICSFEILEVNPTLDKENQMAENAFTILTRATNSLLKG